MPTILKFYRVWFVWVGGILGRLGGDAVVDFERAVGEVVEVVAEVLAAEAGRAAAVACGVDVAAFEAGGLFGDGLLWHGATPPWGDRDLKILIRLGLEPRRSGVRSKGPGPDFRAVKCGGPAECAGPAGLFLS